MPDSAATPAIQLGDYRLLKILSETPLLRTWLAEQASVGREVLLDELTSDDPGAGAGFLADVRAKAAVNHPLIGSVYEAVNSEAHCFCAREKLAGRSLAELAAKGVVLKPVTLARILRKTAEACLHLEGRELAAEPLELGAIQLDEHGVVRLHNLVTAGPRDPVTSRRDCVHLGQALAPLLAQGHPGTTRLLTLLSWMAGQDPKVSLDWAKVRDYAQQIDQQLAEPLPAAVPHTSPVRPKKCYPIGWILGGAAAAAAVAGLAFLASRSKSAPAHLLPGFVEIPAGQFPGPDAAPVAIKRFWLAGHETTIREYREFLEQLAKLDPALRTAHDHENQPATKKSHEPEDWAAMFQAASDRLEWKGRKMNLDCPVTGVDWWDAEAYCDWRDGRLPTQEEWHAALEATRGKLELGDLQPAGWGPVASSAGDRTPGGLHDMAGSVSEWTRRPAANPALPMAARKFVVIGGSAGNPGNGVRNREWLEDRSARRPDLGFRVAFDHPPS
jgi:formylglycine-generating enzyme required for sulfatase activity